jgi:RND family efflux transporter MFP subunit
VLAGAVLARIIPRSDDIRDAEGLRAALVESEQSRLLALQDRDRAARLVEARAVPSRRLNEAESALTASEARLDAAQVRWSRFESLSQSAGGGRAAATFAVRAPFDGVVSEVRFTAGGSVDENELLMRVVDPNRVHAVGLLTELLASKIGTVTAGELVLNGQPSVRLEEPFASSPVIDPVARTTEIRFALDNRHTRLRIGQAVRLRLFVGDEESVTAVPESAVIDDGGRPVVFVQTGGESFERRPVQLGSRADGYVQVVGGVESGERVVHRGGYLVRLAAMSTQIPAHGHAH